MALLDKIYEYFDRKSDLHVLFIFDKMEERVPELEGAEWKEGFHYEVFDGGAFRVKYNLEHDWKDLKVVLLVKDYSPYDEKSRLDFPLLDVLASNMEFKNDSAELYMQEHGIKYDLIDYVKRNVAKLQRKKNDELLTGLYKDLTTDILNRSIISAEMDSKKLLDWTSIFLKLIQLGRAENETRRNKVLFAIMGCRDALTALEKAASRTFGYKSSDGRSFDADSMLHFIAKSLKYNSICGNLTLAKGDVYGEFKVKSSLEALNAVWEQGMNADAQLSEALDEMAADIKEDYILNTYGAEADYFRLTRSLAFPIVQKLLEERLWVAPAEVNERIRSMLNKAVDEDVKATLDFASKLCDFYATKAAVKTGRLSDPKDYVQAYTSEIYMLDMFYRQALELFTSLGEVPIYEMLEEAKRRLNLDYAKVTNELNLNWMASVNKYGFGGVDLLRQKDFYDKYEKPGVKLVVIVSDAFRYELAQELVQEMAKSKHKATIEAAIAQLPTETKFCKPALLPHETLEFDGSDVPTMKVDGKVLVSTDSRTEQLLKYVPDAACIDYKQMENMTLAEKREFFKRPLVYIFHNRVDEDGHDVIPSVKDWSQACRQAIDELAALVRSLHASINVSNVIVTADHGFIFNDIEIADKDKHSVSEESLEKKSRYYLTQSCAKVFGMSKFPLSKVSGMEVDDVYVAVPDGTNRIAVPGGYNFAHGGASLQEMIIPVIRSNSIHDDMKNKVEITLMDAKLKITSSILKFQLLQKQAVSKEYKERTVSIAIYDKSNRVTEEKRLALDSTDAVNLMNRLFEVKLALNKSTSSNILELRIYDIEDMLNPIVRTTVINDTLIEQDF